MHILVKNLKLAFSCSARKSLKDAVSAKDEQKKLYDEVLLQMNEREGKISVLEKEITKLSLDNDDLKTSKEKCETRYGLFSYVTLPIY